MPLANFGAVVSLSRSSLKSDLVFRMIPCMFSSLRRLFICWWLMLLRMCSSKLLGLASIFFSFLACSLIWCITFVIRSMMLEKTWFLVFLRNDWVSWIFFGNVQV